MNVTRQIRIAVVAGTLSLPGCSYMRADAYGVAPLLPAGVQSINLIDLIDPTGAAAEDSTAPFDRRFSIAVREFYGSGDEITLQRLRNGIQERIMIASNQMAAEFEKVIKKHDSRANFSFGSLTTILAGLGAIFTPASTVRALSGSASVVSGIRAEWNDAVFNNLTIQLVIRGMDARRTRIYREIRKRRDGKSLAEYTLEEAIKDAVSYHSAYNVTAGIEESGLALDERMIDPGLRRLQALLGDDPVLSRSFDFPSPVNSSITDAVTRTQQIRGDVLEPFAGTQSAAEQAKTSTFRLHEQTAVLTAALGLSELDIDKLPSTDRTNELKDEVVKAHQSLDDIAQSEPTSASIEARINRLTLQIQAAKEKDQPALRAQLKEAQAQATLRAAEIREATKAKKKLVDAAAKEQESAIKALQAALQSHLNQTVGDRLTAQVKKLSESRDIVDASQPKDEDRAAAKVLATETKAVETRVAAVLAATKDLVQAPEWPIEEITSLRKAIERRLKDFDDSQPIF